MGKPTGFKEFTRELPDKFKPAERVTFYRDVLDMNLDRVRRHWIGVVFAGETAMPPREAADPEQARRYVAEHTGALAFVDARAVDGSVRVLAINGKLPADPGYPIR